MSSLLQPPTIEYCHTNLRGRRLSFNPPRPQEVLSQLRAGIVNFTESAVVDDATTTDIGQQHPRSYSSSLPSPLSDVHISGNVSRHQDTISPTSDSTSITIVPRTGNTSLQCSESTIELGYDRYKRRNESFKLRYFSAFFLYFLFGWGDGVTGTVLPHFQSQFNLSYMISSLLFAGSTCGFSIGTVVVERALSYLGTYNPSGKRRFIPILHLLNSNQRAFSPSQARYLSLLIASCLHATFFVIMGLSTGFPTLFMAYVVAALARSLATASMNAYLAETSPGGLGFAFGCWSFGGAISPIVCQALIAKGVPWPHFYFGSLCLSAINLLLVSTAFKLTPREISEDYYKNVDHSDLNSVDKDAELDERMPPMVGDNFVNQSQTKYALRRALSLPYLWAFVVYLCLYCGSETTTQGLMATYLLAVRNANPTTVGYVTSGFWGGMTLGRFIWGYYSARVTFFQRRIIIQGCITIALVMHLLIWFVPSNVENSFSTAVIGTVYGPIWPSGLATANDLLPAEVHMIAMAIVSTAGSLGSSLFPFITGTIATLKGAQILTYVTVSQAAILLILWSLFPSRRANSPTK